MEIPRSDVPEGTIVQVFQSGFMIEDRVLRPAMVGVAKGGPKLPPTDGSGPAHAAGERKRAVQLGGRSGEPCSAHCDRVRSLSRGEREQRIDQERSYHAAQCHDDVVMPREALPRGIGQFARSRNGIAGGTQSVQRHLPYPVGEPQEAGVGIRPQRVEAEQHDGEHHGGGDADQSDGDALKRGARAPEQRLNGMPKMIVATMMAGMESTTWVMLTLSRR